MSTAAKIPGRPQTANEALLQRSVRHQLLLQRVGNREAASIRRLLKEAHADALVQLERRLSLISERGFDLGPATTRRLQDLATGLQEMMSPTLKQAQQQLAESLTELAQTEVQFQVGLVQQVTAMQVEMVLPSVTTLQAVVTARPFDGRLLGEWFDELERRQQTRVLRAVRLGVVEGETVPQMARRLQGEVLDLTRRGAENIVRTAVNHISAHAREAVAQTNMDIVAGVQWVSTLDSLTCFECQALDGQVFDVGSGPRPPRHLNCRCGLTYALKSWRELGIDLDEAPEGTRASMDGQVPDSLTYNAWLRGRAQAGDMATVEDALGKTRAKLFAAGGLKVEQFVDQQGQMLTLKELKGKEADVFKQLNLN